MKYTTVRTRTGAEVHLGEPGRSRVVGHQLPNVRSVTYRVRADDVTCTRCRNTPQYLDWYQKREGN